jgi:hypothetical protein
MARIIDFQVTAWGSQNANVELPIFPGHPVSVTHPVYARRFDES